MKAAAACDCFFFVFKLWKKQMDVTEVGSGVLNGGSFGRARAGVMFLACATALRGIRIAV